MRYTVYPRLHRRFGHVTILRAQIALYPFIFLTCPIISLCRKQDVSADMGFFTTSLLIGLLIVECAAQTVFISGDLICTNVAPEQSQQSQFNAAVETGAKVCMRFPCLAEPAERVSPDRNHVGQLARSLALCIQCPLTVSIGLPGVVCCGHSRTPDLQAGFCIPGTCWLESCQ